MWKPVVVATATLAIAGSSLVYAQQRLSQVDYRDGPRAEYHHRFSPEDRAAFAEARIAALKAGLQLTPDQAKNWPAFEQALRDLAKLHADRVAAREAAEQNPSQAPSAPFDRLAQRADNLAKASAALKHVAETGQPLYASLSDGQKERFKVLAHVLRPHHHARFEERRPGWRDGREDGNRGDRFWQHRHRFGQDDNWQGGRFRRLSGEEGSEL
jgi:zinc resistance-associated protein